MTLLQQPYTLDEIVGLWRGVTDKHPELVKGLEDYFGHDRSERLSAAFTNYLRGELLAIKRDTIHRDQYVSLALSFEFTARLLGLFKADANNAIYLSFLDFQKVLKQKYNTSLPQVKFDFEGGTDSENKFLGEDEALKDYSNNLDEDFKGNRDVKDLACTKLRNDGIKAVMRWQHYRKELCSQTGSYIENCKCVLSEAFGRSIVIPAFFSIHDKKLENFYRKSTDDIKYYIEVPDSIPKRVDEG
jgi:hypothetical protein